jgi:hypothetical protein
LNLKCDLLVFQAFSFKFNLYHYTEQQQQLFRRARVAAAAQLEQQHRRFDGNGNGNGVAFQGGGAGAAGEGTAGQNLHIPSDLQISFDANLFESEGGNTAAPQQWNASELLNQMARSVKAAAAADPSVSGDAAGGAEQVEEVKAEVGLYKLNPFGP